MTYLEKLKKEARDKLARLNEIRGMDDDKITDELRTEMQTLMDDLDSLKGKIDAEERALALNESLSQEEVNDPNDKRGNNHNDPNGGGDPGHPAAGGAPAIESNPKGGFRSMAHFCHDIYRAGPGVAEPSETLRNWREHCRAAGTPSQSVGDATSGGVLIPTEFSNMFLDRGTEQSDILRNAMILPMATNKLDVPFLDGFDESSGKVSGNVIFYWSGEEKQYTASDFKVGKVELSLNKCTGLAFMTDELMRFSPVTAEPLLMKAFANGYVRAIAKGCIRGTGAGQPLGALSADSVKIEVAKETGQAADTIVIENLAKMFARFYSQDESGGGGTWYVNKTIIPQLITMSLAVGTGGSPVFITNVQDKPGFVIFGDRVRFSSLMSVLGDAGDIAYIDWGQYLIGMPAGMTDGDYQVQQSVHLKFDYDQTTFKFTFYMAGRPWWEEAFTPEYGDTQSPIITLAARA